MAKRGNKKEAAGCVVPTMVPLSKTDVLTVAQFVVIGETIYDGPFYTYADVDACVRDARAKGLDAWGRREDQLP